MDYESRAGRRSFTMKDCFKAMIMAYEIQGMLAIGNAFNGVGLDHVILVKLASAAVSTMLMGGDRDAVMRVVSQVFVDGQSLRTYRHAPNTGSRKSWAAGDACARAVQLSMMVMKGEMGYPSAITAPTWGFQDATFRGQMITPPVFGSYVMENILFKVSYPAEFHAQTAVEAALALYPHVKDKWDDIERIEIETQAAGARIIDKKGLLKNYADRDHCLQYMIAVPLLIGSLDEHAYDDNFAADPRIDALRDLMHVKENPTFTRDYFDLNKRAIPNSIQVFFKDGTSTERVQVDYPLGHRQRREESIPFLMEKAKRNLGTVLSSERVSEVLDECEFHTPFFLV
jgi:2-methylcitrate dehydratase